MPGTCTASILKMQSFGGIIPQVAPQTFFKCFDQLQRDFLIELCRIGGFPPGPLLAYRSFHASCKYYNTIAGGLGDAHDHPCGIPQGCPLSMMIVS